MKKILILSSLALVLTGCSNDTRNSSKPVINKITTSEASEETTKSEEKTTTQEKKEESKDVFKETLQNPERHFNSPVSNVKYVIKNTDTQYLVLHGEVGQGYNLVKVFAYDKDSKKVVDTGKTFEENGGRGQKAYLSESQANPNELYYSELGGGTPDYKQVKITFDKYKVHEKVVKQGQVTDLRELDAVLEKDNKISWQIPGMAEKNDQVKEETTTEKKEEKTEEKKSDNKKEESSSNSLSSEKSEALAKGMKAFGEKMNQVPYEKTDVPDKLTWQSGGDVEGYKIYESYIYESGSTTHRYFFVTNSSGTPEVLYSTGGTSVKHTANADIAAMFRGVHGGSTSSESASEEVKSESKEPTKTNSKLDVDAILKGDYSSIAGTYEDIYVQEYSGRAKLTITKDKIGSFSQLKAKKEGNKVVLQSTAANVGTGSVYIYPAGVKSDIPEGLINAQGAGNGKNLDDPSRDRIIMMGTGGANLHIFFLNAASPTENKEESKPAKSSKLDLDAIAKGDFTSIKGTYPGKNGGTWEIQKSSISYQGRKDEIGKINKEGNVVKIGFPMGWFVVVPAGEPQPQMQGFTGAGFHYDDQSRDRAYIFGNGVNMVFFD